MKKNTFYALLFLSVLYHAPADSLEIFPLPDITLGITVKDLMEQYPSEKYDFHKKTYDVQALEKGVIFYEIPDNKFWDSLGIHIEDARVRSLNYCRINRQNLPSNTPDERNFSNVVQNLKPLFRQLQQQLGTTFEKKVVYRPHGTATTRSAMYVWKRENDVVAFIHTPVALYKKGDIFDCQLSIMPTLEYIAPLMATNSIPEDELLWADAMEGDGEIQNPIPVEPHPVIASEAKQSSPETVKTQPLPPKAEPPPPNISTEDATDKAKSSRLWLCFGIGVLLCLCTIAYLIRKKIAVKTTLG